MQSASATKMHQFPHNYVADVLLFSKKLIQKGPILDLLVFYFV